MADKGGQKRAGGGGDDGKKKRGKYHSGGGSSAAALPHGARGVLISCDTARDKITARDIIALLNEVWDSEANAQASAKPAAAEGASMDKLLAAEVADLKDPKQRRWDIVDLGGKGLIFLHLRAPAPSAAPSSAEAAPPGAAAEQGAAPSVCDLVHAVLRRAEATSESRARFCHRILPVETVCYAQLDDIVKTARPLIAAAFPEGEGAKPMKFAIIYAARNCDGMGLERMQVIEALAKAVPAVHKVDLDEPDLVIIVEVNKSACALSIVKDYYPLCKYNIRTLALPAAERAAQAAAATARNLATNPLAQKKAAERAAAAAGAGKEGTAAEGTAVSAAGASGEATAKEGEAAAAGDS